MHRLIKILEKIKAPANKNKVLYFSVGMLMCFLMIFLFFSYAIYKKSSYIPRDNIIVEKSSSDEDISHLIIENGIASSLLTAKIAVKSLKLFGYRAKFGEYELPKGISIAEAIKIFASGKTVIHKLTIPEGFSVAQTIDLLNRNESLSGEIETTPEEGSLMPDTYCFRYPTPKQHIISLAQRTMRNFINREWPKRSPHCSLETPREAIILASIVEKETAHEREIIAGVYLNRLRKNMLLQSDPTTIYAITRGKSLGRKLLYRDLKIMDPYNTYRNKGLPPTAITNPSRESIRAVLHPAKTDYLFFVFDKKSRHIFSSTFQEHLEIRKNIRKNSSVP